MCCVKYTSRISRNCSRPSKSVRDKPFLAVRTRKRRTEHRHTRHVVDSGPVSLTATRVSLCATTPMSPRSTDRLERSGFFGPAPLERSNSSDTYRSTAAMSPTVTETVPHRIRPMHTGA